MVTSDKKGFYTMKKITSVVIAIALLFALAVTPTMAEISFSDSAVDFVKKIKMGFNLGNTFENRGCICLLIFSDGNV